MQGCPLARLKFDVCKSGSEKGCHRNQLNIVVIKNAMKLYKNQVLGVRITKPTEFSNHRDLGCLGTKKNLIESVKWLLSKCDE